MNRLLALGVAGGLAALVALPGAALATASPSPSTSPTSTASATASPTSSPTGTPSPTTTPTTSPTATPTKSPSASPTPSPTPSKSKPPKKPKHPKPVHHHGTTVTGPRMYNPNTTDSNFKVASTVTVSQTKNLVNQMIQVSWTGFTPSSQPTYDNEQTIYPVMIAECKGTNPATPEDCFNADTGGIPPTFSPFGPTNTRYSTTDPNGTGTSDILLFTSVQNQFLGCGPTTPCSLVVVPAQGGDSLDFAHPHCNDHGQDPGGAGSGLGAGQYDFLPLNSPTFSPNGTCSWKKRIVIPLRFAPTPNGCPLRAADFSAGGSPMLADTMQQWQTGMCFGSNSVELAYNGSINEDEARNFFQAGTLDVAFTTLPLSGTAPHPFTYAPVAVSAASVVYWVDNSNNGQPYNNIKLDARLLTKMLTTSYAYTNDACPGAKGTSFGCDNAVDNNPTSLFSDPEFHKLNPGNYNVGGTEYEIPTVVSGNSDMTWDTTSWIASSKEAMDFLAGQFDQWGSHVNTYYLGLKYPTDAYLPMDPYTPVSSQYVPVLPLSTVARDQSLNQPSGNQDTRDVTTGTFDALPPQVVGQRDLWAILAQADAARFLFPRAALQNAAGKFVEPTYAAMAAAVNDMTVGSDGIRSMNFAKKDAAAYPLTMVIYAVVPTGGISKAKAAKIAQFLDYVASHGQQPGVDPGDLAPGYLPLPQSLRDQTLKAASEVLNQTGDKTPAASPSPSKSPSPSPSPTHSPSPSPSPSASSTATAHSIAVSFSRPDGTGMSWVVLSLLIAGLVLIITGPAALIAASPAARASIGAGTRRLRQLPRMADRTVSPRRGVPRPTWRRKS
jgi:outer membrane biosynthesis protein TonB